jgi:2'-5' RNA ligase
MIRAFLAISLDDDVKHQLFRVGTSLKEKLNLSVKWVKENHLHLTLRFLGNIEQCDVDTLTNSLSDLESLTSFDLNFSQIIAFPLQKPRVIGMAIKPSENLGELVDFLSNRLLQLGFEPEERTFQPHITLGRIAKPRRKGLQLNHCEFPKKQAVTSVTLYQSQISPEGSIYSIIHQFPLKNMSQ